MSNMVKDCKYQCGTHVFWSDNFKFWAEVNNPNQKHDYKRCADIQKQNKGVVVFDRSL